MLDTCKRNLRLWHQWLTSGGEPAPAALDELRESVRARADEGVPLEDLLHAYRIGGRLGWQILRRHARPDEQQVLLDAAELLMLYIDTLSEVVTRDVSRRARAARLRGGARRARARRADRRRDAADGRGARARGPPRRAAARLLRAVRGSDPRRLAATARRARGAAARRRAPRRERGRPRLRARARRAGARRTSARGRRRCSRSATRRRAQRSRRRARNCSCSSTTAGARGWRAC